MKMSTKELNYESYCISSYESETSLESLRETGHPLLGEFEMLLKRQEAYLKLMESHQAISVMFGEDKIGKEFNDKMMESIFSRIVKNYTKANSLYTRMTRKKVDRKAYCRKYYNEHRREIAARHRLYDYSKYKRSQMPEDVRRQYAYQHKNRISLVGKISRFISFDKGSINDYYSSLKRAIKNTTSDNMKNGTKKICL
jgi:hypothetical protein